MESHILAELAQYRTRWNAQDGKRAIPPLIVGVQGPQGSGKTYLTSILRDVLQAPPHNLAVTVLSLDDLYLPHAGLASLAAAHPDNALLRGRGQPGTHDVPLGTELLNKLKNINDRTAGGAEVHLPGFDKSLFDGEGDRVPGLVVRPPVDVVLFEGWCVGFYPISPAEVERRYSAPVTGLGDDFFGKRGYRIEDVLDVNERLRSYVSWWNLFDAFIQVSHLSSVRWPSSAKHNMSRSRRRMIIHMTTSTSGACNRSII